ncbi:30S ribosomal protein S4 [Syntrophus aciditrophicus]|uniref:Small ribosomal subunit protein uS4 n=1 Tax=Syntrophus aciditrophicus (strain SB) TaxID=56780 RepID=RS4_SYNAS|nr:30S ribosomal protein S4 [Syntrophus aciditrophicus]Q2LQD0.1 RecName: Full=Small ribosomal subunit protein uS4; AltName: Full=30S ribosomal protein S4 [Syntrophus aciditrophicus SB]ABC76206.1 SSU ribosomal protein S4P [Syntrophus aciditrophicus SB]
MARYKESACRLCRREGLKLFLKGDRCYGEKCAFERRGYAPGEHGQLRRKQPSDYGVQLREKQKLKRMYGLLEKQFRGYFEKADKKKGITGTNLLLYLERRLDNMVYRLGFANSRNEARQLVRHNHFLVNGRKVNIPSFLVNIGDFIEVTEEGRKNNKIIEAMETIVRRGIPQWLELEQENFKGKVKMLPTREELTMPIQEQLVVELYSK